MTHLNVVMWDIGKAMIGHEFMGGEVMGSWSCFLNQKKKKKKLLSYFCRTCLKKKNWDCLVIFNRNTQIWYLPKFLCMLAFVWLYLIHPNIFPSVIHIVAMTMYMYMFLSVQCLVHIYILNGSKKIVFFLTLFVYICGFCPMNTRF